MVRFRNIASVYPIFTLPRFAGGSSLSEGRARPKVITNPALPGEAPTLPLEDSREGEGDAYPCGTFELDHSVLDLEPSEGH